MCQASNPAPHTCKTAVEQFKANAKLVAMLNRKRAAAEHFLLVVSFICSSFHPYTEAPS